MKYIIRALKYWIYLSLILCIIIFALISLKLVEGKKAVSKVDFGSVRELCSPDDKALLDSIRTLCAQGPFVPVRRDEDFHDVVISAKASNVTDTLAVYRELAERTDCPLHLGVTEAGTLVPGTVRSSVALGILLCEGIGDTIRVSLTGKPEKEVKVGLEILRALGLRAPGPSITSCPTCGRTKVALQRVATQVEEALEVLYRDRASRSSSLSSRPFPHVAVMGCVVNGPGEAKGADIALCGGDGEFLLYVKGKMVSKVDEDEAVKEVVKHVVSLQ